MRSPTESAGISGAVYSPPWEYPGVTPGLPRGYPCHSLVMLDGLHLVELLVGNLHLSDLFGFLLVFLVLLDLLNLRLLIFLFLFFLRLIYKDDYYRLPRMMQTFDIPFLPP